VQLSVREAVCGRAGFQVSIATTAESALATLRTMRDRIGVIVTDHLMPAAVGRNWCAESARKTIGSQSCAQWPARRPSEYEGLEVVFRAKPLPPPELIELVGSSWAEANRQRGAAKRIRKPAPAWSLPFMAKSTDDVI